MKRIISFMFCFFMVLSFFGFKTINAEEEKGDTYLGPKSIVEGIFDNNDSGISLMSNLATSEILGRYSMEGKDCFFGKLYIDGKLVYCIDPYVVAQAGEGYNIDYSKLDEGKKDWLWRVIYYGYGYGDHTSNEWYMATQAVVWQECGFYGAIKDNSGQLFDINPMLTEIYDLADDGGVAPSFAGQTFEGDLNETITITDSNNVLSNFNVGSVKGVNVSQSGNNLSFTITSLDFEGTLGSYSGGSANGPGVVYVKEGSQDLFEANGDEPGKGFQFYVKMATGDLKINKNDEFLNKTSEGHTFDIASDKEFTNILATIKTNKNGIAVLNGKLPKGKYYLKEKSTVFPYILNQNVFEFDIEKDKVTTVDVTNNLTSIDLSVLKKDAKDEGILLNDTTYKIEDITGIELNSIKTLKAKSGISIELSKFSNDTGCKVIDTAIATIESDKLNTIIDGTTSIKCDNSEYVLEVNNETEKEFEIITSENNGELLFVGKTGHVYLRVCDPSNHNYSLKNQKVEVLSENDELLLEGTSDENGLIEISDESLFGKEVKVKIKDSDTIYTTKISSKSEGRLQIDDVKWGRTYRICEIEAKEGYEINAEACRIIEAKTTEDNLVFEVEYTNEKRKLSFELFKRDSSNNALLKGSIFNVTNVTDKDNIVEYGYYYPGMFYYVAKDEEGRLIVGESYVISNDEKFEKVIKEAKTDKRGEILLNLPYGEYYIKQKESDKYEIIKVIEGGFEIKDIEYGQKINVCEIEAPAGYELAKECQLIEIKAPVGEEFVILDFMNKKLQENNGGSIVPVLGIE